jgi:hypothetical protein
MTSSFQEQLLGHLLGALDDAEEKSVEGRLETDADFRRELEEARRLLEPLEAARERFTPPPGLAARTCAFVAAEIERGETAGRGDGTPSADRKPVLPALPPMTPEASPPSWVSQIGWADVAMAVTVFLAAGLLTIPAIQIGRFDARKVACQDNLRRLGTAMHHYSQNHEGYFPYVPPTGNLATAGIYAPVLLGDQYLTEPSRVVCPDSALAADADFHVPSVEEIRLADHASLAALRQRMGGSYGYSLGHLDGDRYEGTRDLGRANFALMADAPNLARPDLQTDNHGGKGQNILLEDGAVRFVSSPKPADLFDDFYHNDRGEVAAGLHRDDSVIGSSATPPITYVNLR